MGLSPSPCARVSSENTPFMKQLHILRHAKSSWEEPDLADHERPLAPRGEKAAVRIADHVRSEGIAPELFLCSTALRTRQTLAALLPVLAGDVEIRLEDGLYGAGLGELLARLREVDDAVGSALVLGHNPTLHELALALTGRSDSLERFPTGALASVTFTGAWADLAEGAAKLEGFFVPKAPKAPG
jgi:phosphohistidine phosphatase